jgi:acyl carrier protein
MDKCLADQVRQFICDFWSQRPDKLRSDTRLEDDLGISGFDAVEFLEAFANAFDVDLTGIEFHKHFGPERGPILYWSRRLKEEMKDLGKYPVTVGHLIEVAGAKRWECPPPDGEKKWPDFPPLGLWDRELDGC